ncbi:MAG: dipeptide epimerase [Campylobacteraceae bacterium]|nr:dipeptide epimerase [Campylobacteraceae bacterium]
MSKKEMEIKSITTKVIKVPLLKPFKTALRSVYELESIIVILLTKSESVGYGETAPTFAITSDSKESILEAIHIIGKNIVGKSILNFNEVLDIVHSSIKYNSSAKSAIEIALYDLFAKSFKTPLYKLLGGSKRTFKTGITISLNDIQTMIKDSKEAEKLGFNSLKIKLGSDYKEDIQRVTEINKALLDSTVLKLDANQGWSKEECVIFLSAMEDKNIPIELIEQPVKKNDIKGLKYIKTRTSIPILADESVFSPMDAIKILEEGAVDFINIKLDKCGGISKALQIADICKLYDVKCMMGCMLEGAISVGAAAHVVSAKSDTITMVDLDAPILCKSSPIKGGARFKLANIELSNASGLGIDTLYKQK